MHKKANSMAAEKTARRIAAMDGVKKHTSAAATALRQRMAQLRQELERQVQKEEERTGIRDQKSLAYSSFAMTARTRIANLQASDDHMGTFLSKVSEEGTPERNLEGAALRTAPPRYVRDAAGNPLTVADLPPADTVRWVVGRKATVVCAVEGGLLSLPEALARYALSFEEFCSWCEAMQKHGVGSLRTTRGQEYR